MFTSTLFLCRFSHLGGVDDLTLIFERRDSAGTGGRAIFFLNIGFGTSVGFSFLSTLRTNLIELKICLMYQ